MKVKVIDFNGKKTEQVELSDKYFNSGPNLSVLATVLDWQISIKKRRTAKTKQRNEITGSTAKIYAQKGTGGARHSSRKAPIFVGGGVAHGPKGSNYKVKKLNKRVKKIGLATAISEKNKEKTLFVVDDFKQKILKTKIFNEFLKKNELKNVLFVADKVSKDNFEKSARNIPDLKITNPIGVNVYDIIKYKNLVFTRTSIKIIEERLSKWRKFIITIA